MAINVRGYAAQSATAPVGPHEFTRRDMRPDDVVIDILYCGVCHTDIHQARNEWGRSTYPMVPGHEIIGRVSKLGSDVRSFKEGEMVGVGCMVDSCQHCRACQAGLENYCAESPTFTYNDKDRRDSLPTFGGYSERIVVNDKFVVHVPGGLDPKAAAPLLCAGITTYSPLRHWNIGQGSKVAVIGLGGLGHMGIKFAHAFGADVTLFTRTAAKEAEARQLGANHVVLSNDEAQMKAVENHFEFILDTVPNPHDLQPYISPLAVDGTLCLVGQLAPLEPPIHTGSLIAKRKNIAGSCIGGIPETQEMLNYCAEKGIDCDIEMIKMRDINHAYERMLRSDVHYRFVIDMASLNE